MQSIVKAFCNQAALLGTNRRFLPLLSRQAMLMQQTPVRYFAAATEIEVKKKEE